MGLFLATPEGLERLEEAGPYILKSGRMLIIREYDFDAIWRWMERRVDQYEGLDWNEVVEKLREHFDALHPRHR